MSRHRCPHVLPSPDGVLPDGRPPDHRQKIDQSYRSATAFIHCQCIDFPAYVAHKAPPAGDQVVCGPRGQLLQRPQHAVRDGGGVRLHELVHKLPDLGHERLVRSDRRPRAHTTNPTSAISTGRMDMDA